jgi:prophage antirepressor-like protein
MSALSLSFNNLPLSPITHNSQLWLTSIDLARSLGYSQENAITKTFNRHKDEFTDSMSVLVPCQTGSLGESSGLQSEQRIFSLRGCHLLAMFSRTAIAKEFRKWVLDILDNQTQPTYGLKSLESPRAKKAIKGGLFLEQQDQINDLIKERLLNVPQERKAAMAIRIYSAINTKFGTKGMKDGYKNIEPEHINNILLMIARLPIDEKALLTFEPEELNAKIAEAAKVLAGELLPKEPATNSITINLAPLEHGKVRCWIVSQSAAEAVMLHAMLPESRMVSLEEAIIWARSEDYVVVKKDAVVAKLLA